jgi:glutamine amidotransferase
VIAIVDYGLGNLGSVLKAFRHAGAEAVLTGDAGALRAAEGLVLPGDGAVGAAMAEIRGRGLEGVLRDAVGRGTPVLGICIGMQVLFEESEEHGRHRGLGLLPGRVRRLEVDRLRPPLPVPHMGWNVLRKRRPHPLLDDVADGAHVYFVHSYACEAREGDVVAETDYGGAVAAVVARGPVVGVQFHPEKSQAVGLRMVARFAALCAATAGAEVTEGAP